MQQKLLYLIGFVFFLLLGVQEAEAQQPVQLSGVVLTNDSIPRFIPLAYARVIGRPNGAVADDEGFFSLVAMPGDTIAFTHLGFQTERLFVPDSLSKKEYLVEVHLRYDTTLLSEVVLYPWPTPDKLQAYLLGMRLETTELDIAQRNVAIQLLRDRAATMGYDAGEIQDIAIKMHEYQMYNSGRYYGADGGAAILGALTNPLSWLQLFDSLKSSKK
jgi:hypothetical protein